MEKFENKKLDMIYSFIEGGLNASQEEILFNDLSSNQDLRTGMKQALMIGEAFTLDSENIIPPPELKYDILGSIGSGDWTKKDNNNSFLIRLNNFSKYLLTGMLSVVLSLFLFDNINKGNFPEYRINNKSFLSGSKHITKGEPALSENSNKPIIKSSSSPLTITKNNAGNFLNRYPDNKEEDSVNKNKSLPPIITKSLQAEVFENNLSYPENSLINKLIPDNLHSDIMSLNENNGYGFSIGLKGFNAIKYNENNINRSRDTYLNDKSVSLACDISETDNISLEFGQEKFGQTFKKVDVEVISTIRQNPLLFWIGAGYQRNFKTLLPFNFIYPYGRFLAGGTRLGPVIKEGIGLIYTPDKAVSFQLGFDATQMFYPAFGSIKASTKFAFSYGIYIRY